MSISIHACLVDSESEAIDVVLGDWLTAGGLNSQAAIADFDAEECVREYVDACGLTITCEESPSREETVLQLTFEQVRDNFQTWIDDARDAEKGDD